MAAGQRNLDPDGGIICAMCGVLLSAYHPAEDRHDDDPRELLAPGKVPVPNFGWFCSHDCAEEYEITFHIHFRRNEEGKVSYYDQENS